MSVKRTGLGRNLSALLGENHSALLAEHPPKMSLHLDINCLQPGKYQPRSDIDEESLTELAQSIKQQGVLQPLLVRETSEGCYEILAGERRWRGSILAGLKEVPVILKQVDDETAMALALIENLQREDLNAMDQARAMERLTREFALTHQQIADLLSKSRAAVSNFLRLLSLSSEVKRLLEHGDIDMGHARALLVLEQEQQIQVAQIIITKQLSVRETEKLAARVKNGKIEQEEKPALKTLFKGKVDALSQRLQTKIVVKQGASGKGSLVIHYKNAAILEDLLNRL